MSTTADCPRCAAADSERPVLVYLAARYLGIGARDWDALHPDDRRAYFDGLVAEGLLKLPATSSRRVAIMGSEVVDLQAIIRDCKAS